MVHVSHNDFAAFIERTTDREAYEPNEGRRIHPERNLAGIVRVHQHRDALSGALDGSVDFSALCIPPATLHVAFEKVHLDGVEYHLGRLGSGCIVEKYESLLGDEGGESSANALNIESGCIVGSGY